MRQYPFLIKRLAKHGLPADADTTRLMFPSPATDSVGPWLLTLFYLLVYAVLSKLGWVHWWHCYPDDFREDQVT